MKKTITIALIILTALIIFVPKAVSKESASTDGDPSLRLPAIVQATTTVEEAVEQEDKTYYDTAPEGLADENRYKSDLRAIALAKGLSEAKIKEIEDTIGGDGINPVCPNGESGWNPGAEGDKGTSFGLVQIHLPAHPHVTEAQAKNPDFALNFIVDAFISGDEWMWTCHKAIYGNG